MSANPYSMLDDRVRVKDQLDWRNEFLEIKKNLKVVLAERDRLFDRLILEEQDALDAMSPKAGDLYELRRSLLDGRIRLRERRMFASQLEEESATSKLDDLQKIAQTNLKEASQLQKILDSKKEDELKMKAIDLRKKFNAQQKKLFEKENADYQTRKAACENVHITFDMFGEIKFNKPVHLESENIQASSQKLPPLQKLSSPRIPIMTPAKKSFRSDKLSSELLDRLSQLPADQYRIIMQIKRCLNQSDDASDSLSVEYLHSLLLESAFVSPSLRDLERLAWHLFDERSFGNFQAFKQLLERTLPPPVDLEEIKQLKLFLRMRLFKRKITETHAFEILHNQPRSAKKFLTESLGIDVSTTNRILYLCDCVGCQAFVDKHNGDISRYLDELLREKKGLLRQKFVGRRFITGTEFVREMNKEEKSEIWELLSFKLSQEPIHVDDILLIDCNQFF
jgi:hypothetical protein